MLRRVDGVEGPGGAAPHILRQRTAGFAAHAQWGAVDQAIEAGDIPQLLRSGHRQSGRGVTANGLSQSFGLGAIHVMQEDFLRTQFGEPEGDGTADAASADQQHAARRPVVPSGRDRRP